MDGQTDGQTDRCTFRLDFIVNKYRKNTAFTTVYVFVKIQNTRRYACIK